MKKVEKKTADAVAEGTIELLRPYKDQVLTIAGKSLVTIVRWQESYNATTILIIPTSPESMG